MNYTKFFITRYWFAAFILSVCTYLLVVAQLNDLQVYWFFDTFILLVWGVLGYGSFDHYKKCKEDGDI